MPNSALKSSYPFGSVMAGRSWTEPSLTTSYKYSFNGKETDDENSLQDYGMRIYNPALGRFLSVDPIAKDYPFYSPYHFAGNTPIWAIDLDGLEPIPVSSPLAGGFFGAGIAGGLRNTLKDIPKAIPDRYSDLSDNINIDLKGKFPVGVALAETGLVEGARASFFNKSNMTARWFTYFGAGYIVGAVQGLFIGKNLKNKIEKFIQSEAFKEANDKILKYEELKSGLETTKNNLKYAEESLANAKSDQLKEILQKAIEKDKNKINETTKALDSGKEGYEKAKGLINKVLNLKYLLKTSYRKIKKESNEYLKK